MAAFPASAKLFSQKMKIHAKFRHTKIYGLPLKLTTVQHKARRIFAMGGYIPIFLYIVSAMALAILNFLIYRLAAPFIGWKQEFSSLKSSAIVNIPKRGKYDINISRERYWLFRNGEGPQVEGQTLAHALPEAEFEVRDAYTDEQIPCRKKFLFVFNKKSTKVNVIVGRISISAPGSYTFSKISNERLLDTDKVQVRKFVPSVDSFSCTIGIIFSSIVFLMGVIFGTLMMMGSF